VTQIAPGIHAIEGLRMGRAYIVEGAREVILVDTSSAGVADRIGDAVTAVGRRLDELTTIVATHYHFDHVGNAADVRERTGAQLCVHEGDAPYVEAKRPWQTGTSGLAALFSRFAPKQTAIRVDRVLHDGDVVGDRPGLQVIHAPGHTPGHIALYSRHHRTLFTGDALMNVLGLQLPPSGSTHDMLEAKRSIQRLVELDFDIALPGHGHPILSRANEKVAEWCRRWLDGR
jgi:glyoxylase-like metal-dependent hydrolase (beta-lactamase superfamily II)